MNKIGKAFRKLHEGQGGVTLIELLVVVVILGVIAAIVVLNVGGFIGTGKAEAANTEAHQVQTAIVSCMTKAGCNITAGSIGPATTGGPADYLLNAALLQADYTYDTTTGEITGATPITESKWDGCNFTAGVWTC